jgi:agmatinase
MSTSFLALTPEDGATLQAPYLILPVPSEQTVSYGRGCAAGPDAILAASREVELFDEELECEPYRAGIGTLAPLAVEATGPERTVDRLAAYLAPMVDGDRMVVTLGGEHSITPGPVRAYQRKYPGLSVLQIDAHADLRESYQGNPNSHASAMKRVRDTVSTTVGVGIRNLSAPEFEYYKATEDCHLYFAHQRDPEGHWINDAIDQLTDDVYITIDLDGLDPALMPAVGTPEPGGLSWEEVMALLRRVTLRRNVVGADVVELAPIGGMHMPDFVAARLVYKLIAYVDRGRRAVRSADKK